MKRLSVKLLMSVAVLAITLFFVQCSKSDGAVVANAAGDETFVSGIEKSMTIETETDGIVDCIYDCLNGMPFEDLSETEIAALSFVREEELLAHDIYVSMYAKYHVPVFNNISNSEEIHTTAIKALMEKYSLTDIAADHVLGVFVNQDVQQLYDALLALGLTSLNDAITVGAIIEDYDIADLVYHASEDIDNVDILYTIDQLHRGSRNHMRAFYAHLNFHGLTYTPQYITQEMYDAIVTTGWEIGSGFCICQYEFTDNTDNKITE
jgi:hypothetical protein